jgi:uncharacterized paraquat-inducible protein A
VNTTFAYLTLVSWLTFIGNLRYFARTRILLEFIKQSALVMIPFGAITLLMLLAFALTFTFIRGGRLSLTDSSTFTQMVQLLYKSMYGDFEEFTTHSGLEYLLFFLVTVIIPLLLLSLLIAIISEAHQTVVENQNKIDYS